MKLILTSIVTIIFTLLTVFFLMRGGLYENYELTLPKKVAEEIDKDVNKIIYLVVVRNNRKIELITRDGKVIDAPSELIDPDQVISEISQNMENTHKKFFLSHEIAYLTGKCPPIQDNPLPSWANGNPSRCWAKIKPNGDSGMSGSHCHCY